MLTSPTARFFITSESTKKLRFSVKNLALDLAPYHFLSCYADIANLSVRLSVRYVLVSDENGLTYCHGIFTIR